MSSLVIKWNSKDFVFPSEDSPCGTQQFVRNYLMITIIALRKVKCIGISEGENKTKDLRHMRDL